MRLPSRASLVSTLSTFALAAGVFLAVLGLKLIVVDRYGSDAPNWDQWDAEGQDLLLPYLQGRLGVLDLFKPHNEHRVVATRLLALAGVVVNGQWDARLQCVVNAILHAGIGVGAFLYLRRLTGALGGIALAAATVASFGPPIAFSNVVSGFHSQQYFLAGFSLATIALWTNATAFSGRWFAGLACAVASLFTMGSGLLAAAAVAVALTWADGFRSLWRRHLATVIACLAVVALGWSLRVSVVYHEPLMAHSLGDFSRTLRHNLQWPAVGFAPFALLGFTPWLALAWRLRRRPADDRRALALCGAGAWVLLQFAATAYARGSGGGWPADRYLDTFTIGLLVNAAAILFLLRQVPPRRWLRCTQLVVAAAWVGFVAHGLTVHLGRVHRGDLPAIKEAFVAAQFSARAYLITGDEHFLTASPALLYPGKEILVERLSHPEIRAILPASLRPPLRLEGRAEPAGSFAPPPASHPFATPWPSCRSDVPDGAGTVGEWRSAPVARGRFPIWRIEVTGHPGLPGVSLALASAGTGRELAHVVPRRSAEGSWRPAFVAAPREPAVLLARDESADRWLGFCEPVEVARFSYWAALFVKRGLELVVLGAGLALAGAAATLLCARARPPVPAGQESLP